MKMVYVYPTKVQKIARNEYKCMGWGSTVPWLGWGNGSGAGRGRGVGAML